MRILNLHGFGGSANNTNYNALRVLYPEAEIISEAHDYLIERPEDIIDEYCHEGDFDIIVGNSFGGFLAYIIGAELNRKTILTNPCIPPYEYIPKVIENYRYPEELKELWNAQEGRNKDCHILIGLNDEVLNPNRTIDLMTGKAHIGLIPDAGHHIEGSILENWLKENITE